MLYISQRAQCVNAGNRLTSRTLREPDSQELSNAAWCSKEPTRMEKNPVESVRQKSERSPNVLTRLVTIGALSSIALTGCAAEQAPEKPPVSTEQTTETPEPVEVEKTFEQLVDEQKIEAGLSAEEYAETLFGRFAAWNLAGKEQYWDEWWAEDSTEVRQSDEMPHRIAEEQKLIFANALFHPGWQEDLSILADQWREDNEILLVTWRKAYDYDGSNGTPEWEQGNVVQQVEVLAEDLEAGTRRLYVAGYETNNGADTKNAQSPNVKYNGAPWSFYIDTVSIDGYEYISGWSVKP